MSELSVEFALSFSRRLLGLIGRRLPPGAGLIFPRCRAVHGFFLRRLLDCVFLDGAGRVLEVRTLRPWQVLAGPQETEAVLELEEGEAARLGLRPGVWLIAGVEAGTMLVAELPEGGRRKDAAGHDAGRVGLAGQGPD